MAQTLTTLPPELREQIWRHLQVGSAHEVDRDLAHLGQTCRLSRYDVDAAIGLRPGVDLMDPAVPSAASGRSEGRAREWGLRR
jgi:hypothetical protein